MLFTVMVVLLVVLVLVGIFVFVLYFFYLKKLNKYTSDEGKCQGVLGKKVAYPWLEVGETFRLGDNDLCHVDLAADDSPDNL